MAWNLSIEMIDVASGAHVAGNVKGIGDSTFITAYTDDKSTCKTMLIDGGNFDRGDMVNKYIIKSLKDKSLKSNNVDVIVISHFHSDHYGGILEILISDNLYVLSKFIHIKLQSSIKAISTEYPNLIDDSNKEKALILGSYCILLGIYNIEKYYDYDYIRNKIIINNINCSCYEEKIRYEIIKYKIKDEIKDKAVFAFNKKKKLKIVSQKIAEISNNSLYSEDNIVKIYDILKCELGYNKKNKQIKILEHNKLKFRKSKIYCSKHKRKISKDPFGVNENNNHDFYNTFKNLASGCLKFNSKNVKVPGICPNRLIELNTNNCSFPMELFEWGLMNHTPPEIFMVAAQQHVWNGGVEGVIDIESNIMGIQTREKVDNTENINSIALLVRFNYFFYLTAGDLPKRFEEELANKIMNHALPNSTIPYYIPAFKCSHHGSDSSTSSDFLRKIMPSVVLVSCGNNSDKHPYLEVINNLQDNQNIQKFLLTGFNIDRLNCNNSSHSDCQCFEHYFPNNIDKLENQKSRIVGNGRDGNGNIKIEITECESKKSTTNGIESKFSGNFTVKNVKNPQRIKLIPKNISCRTIEIDTNRKQGRKRVREIEDTISYNNKRVKNFDQSRSNSFLKTASIYSTITSVQELYNSFTVKIQEEAGKLILTENTTFPACLNKFIARVPIESVDLDTDSPVIPSLTIYNCELTLENNGSKLTLQGNCKPASQIENATWSVEGLTWADDETPFRITVSDISIIIEDTENTGNPEFFTLTGWVNAGLPLHGSQTDVYLYYQPDMEDNPWLLALDENNNNAGMSIFDIVSIAYNFPMSFEIPPALAEQNFLNNLLTVDPTKFFILFYPNTDYESYTYFTINAPFTWEPLENIFSFNGLEINGTLRSSSISLVLIGHVTIGNIAMDVGISLSDSRFWLVYVCPTTEETFPGLATLARWIGGEILKNDIDSGFSALSSVSINGFDAAISYINAYVDVRAGELQTFNIGSILTIGTDNEVNNSQALKLDIQLALPSLTIDGSLHVEEALNIQKFLKGLNFSDDAVSDVPEALEIAYADFHAGLRDKNYSLSMQINGIWTIEETFSLDSISFYLGYNTYQSLHGSFSCECSFPLNEEESLNMVLNAEYGGTGEGWVFNGGIETGTTLSIESFLTMLQTKLNEDKSEAERIDFAQQLPEPVKTLVLTRFEMSYATKTKKFDFVCTGNFEVDDTPVEMSVAISVSSGTTGGRSFSISCLVNINGLNFNVKFHGGNSTILVGTYHHNTAEDGQWDVNIKDLVAGISSGMAEYIPEGLWIDLKEVKFIFHRENNENSFLFGLQFGVDIDLKTLPVVGDKLPDDLKMSINDMQVLVASKAFTKEQITVLNPLLPEGILSLPTEGLPKGLLISGELNVLGFIIPIDTGKKGQNSGSQPTPALYSQSFIATAGVPEEEVASPAEITWFNVQKKVGPLEFRRLGFAFADSNVSFVLDASLVLGPAGLSLNGLSINSPLSEFDPVFGLQGLSLSVKKPSFELSGEFLKSTQDGIDSYYGMALFKAGTFGFKALGGYIPAHTKDGTTIPSSFFIYANIDIPIGGPPCFSVSALAGGFGINNRLLLPTVENLPGYILLPDSAPKPPKGATPEITINTVLSGMKDYFIPESGQYWLAVGVSFSSFQMITADAIAAVSFGVDLQVALIGSCSMTFPKGASTPVAFLKIAFMASYTPSAGVLAVVGMVSPASYLFGDFCRISGGFAFYLWINPPALPNGPKPGEFLVSLGGYHPYFVAPPYYPKLPRVGLNLSLPPLQITGEAYFAITPAAMMAGGRLQASWEGLGAKVWLNFGVDFIMAWAPFRYHAVAFANVLVDFMGRHNINANLEIWGPPFGGKARIEIGWLITINIEFGGKNQSNPPLLTWPEFKGQFLPSDTNNRTNILKASVSEGLLDSDIIISENPEQKLDWIIDSDNFAIRVMSAIPASQLKIATGVNTFTDLPASYSAYNSANLPSTGLPYFVFKDVQALFNSTTVWNPSLNIKPMGKNGINSVVKVSLIRKDEWNNVYINSLCFQPVIEDASEALWGNKETNINTPAFIKSALTGIKISPIPEIPDVIHNISLLQLILQQGNTCHFRYEIRPKDYEYDISSQIDGNGNLSIKVYNSYGPGWSSLNENYIFGMLNECSPGKERRREILQQLANAGLKVYTDVNPERFSSFTMLKDWPGIAKLGDILC